MKTLFFICLFLISTTLFSQSAKEMKELRKSMKEHQAKADTTKFPQPFEFVFVDSINLSKAELFSKVNTWLPTVFTNSNLAITKDTTAGKFVLARVTSRHSSDYTYNLTIDVRDNKYRLAFTNFIYQSSSEYSTPYSLDETDKIRAIYFGNKAAYWKDEKLHLMEEALFIYALAKISLNKKDDF